MITNFIEVLTYNEFSKPRWSINGDKTTGKYGDVDIKKYKGTFMYILTKPNEENNGEKRDFYLNLDNLDMIYREGKKIRFVFKDGTKINIFYETIITDISVLKRFFKKKVMTFTFEDSDNLTYC